LSFSAVWKAILAEEPGFITGMENQKRAVSKGIEIWKFEENLSYIN